MSEQLSGKLAVAPILLDTTVTLGPAIDTAGFEEVTIYAITGVDSGTPTSFDSEFTVYEAASTASSAVAAITGGVINITAENITEEYTLPKNHDRYIRVKVENTFVGGTSPKLNVAAVLVKSEPKYKPAA